METIVRFALKSKTWILVLFGSMVAAGFFYTVSLPIDAVPDITNVQVMINTRTGALAPEEIETTVTFPIETELSGLQNVEEVRSITKYGLSQVTVVFEEGTDLYFARQLIAEKLSAVQASLPEGMSPEMGPVSTALGEIVMYAVRAKEGSAIASLPEYDRLRYLRTIQDWLIKRDLKTVEGVAEVDTNGGYRKAIMIHLNPVLMESYGVSVERIMESLDDVGINRGGGYIENDHKRIIVRSQGRLQTVEQIKKIPIRLYALGAPIALEKIAEIREDNLPRVGATTAHGEQTVIGTVLMRIGANSRTVAESAIAKLNEIELPEDVEVEVLYSRSYLVNATIETVIKNLGEGALLVIAVLFFILGNFRAAIIVSLAIPLSMLFAVTGMSELGISANLMSLGAIDFGLLVDASVVMVENIIRNMEERSEHGELSKSEKREIIVQAAKDVSGPVVSGLLIIMIVYIPILSLTGIEGKMFRPMAATVLLALGASLLIAVVLMPVLAYLLIKPPREVKESFLFSWISWFYRPLLRYSLSHRYQLLLPTVLFGIISVAVFFSLGSNFIPRLDEGDLVVGMVRNSDISLPQSVEEQKSAERIIQQFPEVQKVFSRMGTPESATDPMSINFADTFIILEKDKSKWPIQSDGSIRTKEELYEEIQKTVHKQLPGQELSPTQPIEMRFNEMLEGSRADVTLRIFGSDLNKLMELVDDAEQIIKGIDGVSEVAMNELIALSKTPVIDYRILHDRISQYGIHPYDVNRSFEIAMAGEETGYFYEEDRQFPIMVRMSQKYRNDLSGTGRIPVELPGGGTIPLSSLTRMEKGEQVTTIARYNSKRYASVAIYLKDRDVQSFVTEASEKVKKDLHLPEGFSTDWGGQFKNLDRARTRILIILPITLILIFMIVLRTFNDIPQTLLIFSTIPFAATGGILLLALRGISFSISASVGFIALMGIAILNGMVLVSFFNQLREKGEDLYHSVYEGTLLRLRPVLMTALVASLGFIPMAFNTGPGSEVQRPLATVVIGGLITATLLTLLLLPTLYLWLESYRLNRKEHRNH